MAKKVKTQDLTPKLPITESVAQRTIALPFHNNLTEQEIDYVVSNLRLFL